MLVSSSLSVLLFISTAELSFKEVLLIFTATGGNGNAHFPYRKEGFLRTKLAVEEGREQRMEFSYLGAEILGENADICFMSCATVELGKREVQDDVTIFPVFTKPYLAASLGDGRRNLGHLRHLLSK